MSDRPGREPRQRKRRGAERPLKERAGAAISEEKRLARERRLDSNRRAAKMRTIVAAVAVLVLLVACVSLYRSSVFAVRKVEVAGAKRTQPRDVLRVAAVPKDATLLRLPTTEIRDRLVANPWILDAKIERRFPDTVILSITEREPAALVDTGSGLWVVDKGGYVMAKMPTDATSTIAVIRDVKAFKPKIGQVSAPETLLNALNLLTGISDQLRSQVRAISAPSVDETALMTKDGVEVLMGRATEIGKKDLIARKILAEQHGKVVFIDVRTTSRPVSRGLGE